MHIWNTILFMFLGNKIKQNYEIISKFIEILVGYSDSQ